MRLDADSPLARELAATALAYRRRREAAVQLRAEIFGQFAEMFDLLAELERRVDRLECWAGLRRYLAAGGRPH